MKIYLAHSTWFDFKNELYTFIRGSKIDQEHEIILPHEKNDEQFSSNKFFESGCDLMVAEVSYPSTGLGIELGWANIHNIPIICIYRKWVIISWALKTVSKDFLEYEKASEISQILLKHL